MQDVIAIAVAVAAAAWLVRTFWLRLAAPSCGKPDLPPGADGFVPLGDLNRPADPARPRWPPAAS